MPFCSRFRSRCSYFFDFGSGSYPFQQKRKTTEKFQKWNSNILASTDQFLLLEGGICSEDQGSTRKHYFAGEDFQLDRSLIKNEEEKWSELFEIELGIAVEENWFPSIFANRTPAFTSGSEITSIPVWTPHNGISISQFYQSSIA